LRVLGHRPLGCGYGLLVLGLDGNPALLGSQGPTYFFEHGCEAGASGNEELLVYLKERFAFGPVEYHIFNLRV
jgi:hypothetical protein